MYLRPASKNDIRKLKADSAISSSPVSELTPILNRHCQGAIIHTRTGEELGYILYTTGADDLRYSMALVEIGLTREIDGGQVRFVPNLMRTLKLKAALARSDDSETLKTLAHYPVNIYHILQVHRIPEAPPLSHISPYRLVKNKKANPKKLLAPEDHCVLSHNVLDKKKGSEGYELYEDGELAGSAVALRERYGMRPLFVVIRPDLRRRGLGALFTRLLANEMQKTGSRPTLIVRPENETGLRFAAKIGARPEFDLLRLEPRFHASPAYPVESEE